MQSAARRVGLLLAASLLAVSPRPQAQSPGESALDRYARGDYAVIESLTVDRLDEVRREVKASRLSPRVKAAFFLEAFESLQRRLQIDPLDWHDPSEQGFAARDPKAGTHLARAAGARLIDDARDALDGVPAEDAFVQAWFKAAAPTLAHGTYGQSLTEWTWKDTEATADRLHLEKHVDPGELALTRALEAERFAWRSLNQQRETFVVAQQDTFKKFTEKNFVPMILEREKNALSHALSALKKAEAFESARAESLMRQGALVAASGKPDQSLPFFEASQGLTHDNWVLYLDCLLAGRALEVLDRTALAEASYRTALAIRPKARSANLALSALLFAHGRRADASVLVVFDQTSDRFDPWAQLSYGAYRFWPERRDAMRRFLQ